MYRERFVQKEVKQKEKKVKNYFWAKRWWLRGSEEKLECFYSSPSDTAHATKAEFLHGPTAQVPVSITGSGC